ncbi:receptor-like protein kinase FERONIA [Coffea eugenioides]|uniref:receptor-like protein kinase FERONIA n=1 Tax=Coffea eugenioides TaxID=49369 RepID=UPI000F609E74|nr:receptor-like protein kinase FERONIA [Coffea eugenioides]
MPSLQPRGKSRSSTALQESSLSVDPVPYTTARISATPFYYTFQVSPGQKFIRLHFYPASYRGFEKSMDFFTVKAGPFTLLRDFSASYAADTSSVKYLVKEFCVNVEENRELNIVFNLLEFIKLSHLAKRIKYTNMPAFIAPPKLYQTSWKIERDARANKMHKLTWRIPADLGFGYLVRLHFSQFGAEMSTNEQREFRVVINNHIAEAKANVIEWSGGAAIPAYRDYLVKVKGETEGRNCDLLISLESFDVFVFGLLNGVEIFKLSNLENSLATPIPTFPERVLPSWNLKKQYVFLALGQGNFPVTSSMTILIILVNVAVFNLRQMWKEEFHQGKDTQTTTTEASYRCFSLSEIESATQNFNEAFVIGQGGFGKVYRGVIHETSEVVAIKRLKSKSKQGAHEFWTEVGTLSKLRHIHLVSLIGYCNESQKMILVYEYVPCGTLADNLYKNRRNKTAFVPLCWEQRLRICIGAARGLDYLHTGTEYGVIHRDVKDTNILLDENFVAKISDFGLSKLEKTSQSKSYVSTRVKGTLGYLDPYYFRTHQLTRKSDVFAFGIVLLVVLCGRPAMDTENLEQRSLLSCFQECISKGEIDEIIDRFLQGKVSPKSLKIFVKSIQNCLHNDPKERPTMAQVVVSLEDALKRQESTNVSVAEMATIPGDAHWDIGKPIKKKEPCYHFPIDDIRAATDNFSDRNVIMQDAFRKVHRGFLQNMQREVCIYWFKQKVEEEEVLKFGEEMEMLSQLRHPNLLSLLGYCYHETEMYLVFDYVGNRTLSSNLYRSREKGPLNWKCKLQICIGVAKALDYLHNGTQKTVIHMDLRPATILLDINCVPKVSNFGLSKIGHIDPWAKQSAAGVVSETLDHMCPEDISLGVQCLTEKSDVYSFGLVLLEVLCCRRSLSKNSLRDSVRRSIRTKTLHQIVNYLEGEVATACLAEYLKIAFSCLQVQAARRPSMDTVVEKLEFALQLQENAEATKPEVKGKGHDGFKLEDIYKQIPNLTSTKPKWKRPLLFSVCRE